MNIFLRSVHYRPHYIWDTTNQYKLKSRVKEYFAKTYDPVMYINQISRNLKILVEGRMIVRESYITNGGRPEEEEGGGRRG